jgi:hypothetical protein
MSGVLASNADLSNEEGQAAVVRDLERHQLILDGLTASTEGLSIADGTYPAATWQVENGKATLLGAGDLPDVKFLGTLDYPVYDNGGNARGYSAVDWQQERSTSTQVASGVYSTILGGSGNTASGQFSLAGGRGCLASGDYSTALGAFSTATGNNAFSVNSTSPSFGGVSFNSSVSLTNAYVYAFSAGKSYTISGSLADSPVFLLGCGDAAIAGSSPTAGTVFIGCKVAASTPLTAGGNVQIACVPSPTYGGASYGSQVEIACGGGSTGAVDLCVLASWAAIESVRVGGSLRVRSEAAFDSTLTVSGGFGCNGNGAQTKFPSGGAVTNTAGGSYTATEQAMLGQLKTLANNIRTALINSGIMS